ncbi:metal dependent phosphohydrolase [Fusarium austroafricanum]|uniref:Metal dependent phosphohydrolase n=1 Tax=Fusarium austroafricanum TaxID=2364996 RepID=A0A8H4KND1_9HYPO|nr:metal dependent phosphohydrolase [Fusarium austroafricanum]
MSDKINSLVIDKVPQDETCLSALNLARDLLPIPILNHSLRVYLLARYLAEEDHSPYSTDQLSLLFVAAILHDIGTTDQFNGEQRFEICSADCAKAHLLKDGYSEAKAHQVWTAIAIHTSPGIAERIDPLSRLIRLGVTCDFGAEDYRRSMGVEEYYRSIEALLPRLDAEKCLGDAVVKQASKIPHVDSLTWPSDTKFPKASWPGILLRAHAENPGHEGVNPAF